MNGASCRLQIGGSLEQISERQPLSRMYSAGSPKRSDPTGQHKKRGHSDGLQHKGKSRSTDAIINGPAPPANSQKATAAVPPLQVGHS